MFNQPQSTKESAGMVLLLALLILASVLATSLTVGALVLRELRVSIVSDQGQAAYYAAESGLEQGLYLWRLEGKQGSELNANTTVLAGNQATWTRSGTVTQNIYQATLKKDQTAQLDLFDPNDSLSGTTQAQSVKISWDNNPSSCPGAGSEWLELGWSAWQTGSTLNYDVQQRYFSSSQANGLVINFNPTFTNYRLRLRAMYSDICDLSVQAFRQPNAVGDIYQLPARLTINSVGYQGNTSQSLSVTVPQQPTQAPVFDYALFSECSLFKGSGFTSSCY